MVNHQHLRSRCAGRLRGIQHIAGVRRVLGRAGEIVADRELLRHLPNPLFDHPCEEAAALVRHLGPSMDKYRIKDWSGDQESGEWWHPERSCA